MYKIKLNDEEMFEMVIDGVLTDCAFIGDHLLTIAEKNNIFVPSYVKSESHLFSVLNEAGIEVEIEF